MDEQGRQCMAAHSSYTGGPSKHTRPCDSIRQHSKKEMGHKLSIHGLLCFCNGTCLLGRVGFPHVIW